MPDSKRLLEQLRELADRVSVVERRADDSDARLTAIEGGCSDLRSVRDQRQLAADAAERAAREADERRSERDWINGENRRDPVLVVQRALDGAYGRDTAIRRSSACERLGIVDGTVVHRYIVRDSEWKRLLARERELRALVTDGHLVVHRATNWHDIAGLINSGERGAAV